MVLDPSGTWLGLAETVTEEGGATLKEAVSVMGPFMVIEAGLFVPEYDPVPVPVQLLKLEQPLAGLAVIDTIFPLFCQPVAGVTLPPVPWFIVS